MTGLDALGKDVQYRTKAVLLTARVPAAIATIAVEGPEALACVAHHLITARGKSMALSGPRACFAHWRFRTPELTPEHVVVLVKSSTYVELNCHGGLAVIDAILNDLSQAGCLLAEESSGPEIEHSVLSQEAIERDARQALIHASTLKVAAILLDQWQGTLSTQCDQLRQAITSGQPLAVNELREQLLQRAAFGLKLTDPWRITLAGPPNVGKSSLLNAMCGTTRVLVHEQPGTTRDAVGTAIVVHDWPLIVTDTAGIRSTDELIESQGIERARTHWLTADIGILVVDATIGWTNEHTELVQQRALAESNSAYLVVLNKCDQVDDYRLHDLRRSISMHIVDANIVGASAISPGGIDDLLKALGSWIDQQQPPAGAGVPFTLAQVEAIREL